MVRSLRVHRRPAPHGKTAAIVLLVLAAICLIVGAAGSYFAYAGFQGLMTMLASVGSSTTPALVSPGELTVQGGPGAIMVVARASDTVDGKAFSYPPTGGVTVAVSDAAGNPVQKAQQGGPAGGGPMPLPDGGSLFIVGAFEANAAGTYTVKATGAETALRVKFLEGKDGEAAAKGALSGVGGGFGAICGCGGFLVFGIIGGILLIFGKKKAA